MGEGIVQLEGSTTGYICRHLPAANGGKTAGSEGRDQLCLVNFPSCGPCVAMEGMISSTVI